MGQRLTDPEHDRCTSASPHSADECRGGSQRLRWANSRQEPTCVPRAAGTDGWRPGGFTLSITAHQVQGPSRCRFYCGLS